MTARMRSFAGAALLLLLAVGIWVFTASLATGTPSRMGPRFIPLLIAGLLAVFALVLAAEGLRTPRGVHDSEDRPDTLFSLKILLLIVGSIVLFGHGIRLFGLAPTSFATVLLASIAAWDMKWHEAIIMSIVLSVFSVLLFRYGLGLNLPVWPV